ncbi:MAG: mechanosensitive ion channel family protein [Phenylobacterium sp.]|nr:mechanosensitive ion channel family protein [Phenylobacterium sp.]
MRSSSGPFAGCWIRNPPNASHFKRLRADRDAREISRKKDVRGPLAREGRRDSKGRVTLSVLSPIIRTPVLNIGQHAPAATPSAALWSRLVESAGDLLVNLAIALVILVITIWLAGGTQKLVRAAVGRVRVRRGPPDPTLQVFVATLARNTVLILGGIAVLQQLGVRTTSIIAAVSAASLAVGLAMQGALSNVAAGVMMFLLRPYRVGDLIETSGRIGRVENLDLFETELATLDNLKVVIPNGKLFGDVVVNHSAHHLRRADVSFHLPLSADPKAIMDGLRARLDADRRVLKDPPPLIELTQLSEAYMEIAVRPWVGRDDYGPVKADVLLWARMLAAAPNAAPPQPA